MWARMSEAQGVCPHVTSHVLPCFFLPSSSQSLASLLPREGLLSLQIESGCMN